MINLERRLGGIVVAFAAVIAHELSAIVALKGFSELLEEFDELGSRLV